MLSLPGALGSRSKRARPAGHRYWRQGTLCDEVEIENAFSYAGDAPRE